MQAKVIRQKYLDFFVKHGHSVIKSAPLVPDNDPTCLFTTAYSALPRQRRQSREFILIS